MAALPLQTKISQSSSGGKKYRVLIAEFGNGYTQRTQDGINSARAQWSISWDNLTSAEKDTVIAALDAAGSHDTHTWTAPDEATSKEWRVTEGYQLSTAGGSIFSISTTLQQEFE